MDAPSAGTLDEILIDWGDLPPDSTAEIYLPAVPAATILDLASRRYTTQKLTRVNEHTLGMDAAGLTYIPVPRGGPAKFAGLLTIDVPSTEHRGQAYQVAVRQITDAFGRRVETPARRRRGRTEDAVAAKPIQWRRTLGAFGLSIPVGAKHVLLPIEERNLSVLRWIGESIPRGSRWDPVFHRYLDVLGGRLKTFGGDPGLVLPSPTGNWREPPGHGAPPTHGGDRDTLQLTGKIAGLIFDHFGDFDGFILETETKEHVFHSRESEIASLAQRAWRERLRLTVHATRHEPHRPLSITVRLPPSPFV